MIEDDYIIRVGLSRIHGEYIWLDKPYQITNDVLNVVIGFYTTRDVLILKSVKNAEVNRLTSILSDGREPRINTLKDIGIRYATMGISYKVYYKNREGSYAETGVYVSYRMIKEDVDFDLYETLKT